jgi:Hydroxymethylglutaryl-coenzyme A reductase
MYFADPISFEGWQPPGLKPSIHVGFSAGLKTRSPGLKSGASTQPTLPERKHDLSSIVYGTLEASGAHSANGLTAMFIATGQDVANVAESHAAIVYALWPKPSLMSSSLKDDNLADRFCSCQAIEASVDFIQMQPMSQHTVHRQKPGSIEGNEAWHVS